MTAPNFYDNSPLSDAEIETVQLLTQTQCEAVAAWLKLYGHAFASQSPQCGRTIRTNFEYAANRLEILGKKNCQNATKNVLLAD